MRCRSAPPCSPPMPTCWTVKRTNISLDAIVKMTKGATDSRTGSFTEIILGLPGDTKGKHVQVRSRHARRRHPGPAAVPVHPAARHRGRGAASRQHCTNTKPASACWLAVSGDTSSTARMSRWRRSRKYASATAPCRAPITSRAAAFDLTIAIFNNGGVLKEFFRLARRWA